MGTETPDAPQPTDQPEVHTPTASKWARFPDLPARFRELPTPPPWVVPAALAALVALSVVLGVLFASASSDRSTLQSRLDASRAELGRLDSQVKDLERHVEDAEDRALSAEQGARRVEAGMAARERAVAAGEQAVAAREQAVTVVEQQVAANSIGQGQWTVGVDVAPGTYRTEAAVTAGCYWSITRSGSNGSDIVDNDIVNGGFPTVTLREGQDFENSRCGTFVKQ